MSTDTPDDLIAVVATPSGNVHGVYRDVADDYDVEIEDVPTPSRDAATAWTALRVVGEVVDELYASRKRLLGALRDLPADVPPQPPAGEGAALIAATEQEIADPNMGLVGARDAWEATARRLAALLDGQRAPVQATTHGEAGESQTGAQDCTCPWNNGYDRGGTTIHHFTCPAARQQETAVQGAGRDWRGVIAQEMAVYASTRAGEVVHYEDMADHLVAALGLHDLEQAAEHNRLRMIRRNGVPVMISKAGVEHMQRTIEELRVQRDRAEDQRDEARQDLFAARRELEQLRGEVERLRLELSAIGGRHSLWGFVNELDDRLAALAATAPATQDGSQA